MNDRLYRSRDDRMLAGVAGGLAEYWDADPSLIRIVWALLVIFTGGIALIAYIVMALVVPEDPGFATTFAGPAAPAGVATATGTPGATWQPPPDWRSQRAASRAAARDARRAARVARGAGPRTGTLIVGGALVLLGTWFLLDEYVPAFRADLFWPIALVGLGVLILAAAVRPREEAVVPPATAPQPTPAAAPPAPTPVAGIPAPAEPSVGPEEAP
jgi:phage shock protein C